MGWIFNGQYGILNSILEALGILETGIPWLDQTNTALLCVVIAHTWQMLPWYMAFLLGGLQSVSLEQVGPPTSTAPTTGRPSGRLSCPA